MEVGFERACVDVIASRAGVSKATVYNHFHDKSALFIASFSEQADALRAGFLACLLSEPKGELEEALECVGVKLVSLVLSPAVVALYRHTSAESARFPPIGHVLFERGPTVVQETIGTYLKRWEERGALRIEQPRIAAVHFSMLCQGDLYLRAQLGVLAYPADDQILESVKLGVSAFIRAYGR